MQLSLVIVDIYSFYDWPVDLQILPLRTRSQCGVSDTQVTVDARRRKQVQECSHSVRLSVRPSVSKSCHHNSSETTDPIIMKLGMQRGHHMQLCKSAGNFDPLIFVGVMPLGTQRIFVNQLTVSFLCNFFINEITASDAGPEIIRSHLFLGVTPF